MHPVEPSPSRKLAVLLHADVVGSTALVRLDETLAHQRIQGAFKRLSELISGHAGIAHEIRGDALVAEFAKASDAVAASVAFQIAHAAENEMLHDDIRPAVRIGIAIGEVLVADNTVTGEGIVLAQRLEQLAEPGGVCIQDAAYQTMPKRLPFAYKNLGENCLKGFDEPVKAYAVRQQADDVTTESAVARTGADVAPELSDKPSIAVLPFQNMSSDPEQAYFADGIAEDIITALSHIKQWFVVARNSSFVYKDRNVDIRDVAQKLGVRYVLEGSVRKGGSRLRITGQLIEAQSGTHLWADRFDGDLADVFALQDKIAESVVGAIEPSVLRAEIERSKRKPPKHVGAYDLYLQALPPLYAMRPDENEQALNLLHQAIALDSNYARALAYLAWAYQERLTRNWGAYGEDDASAAVGFARRAISADRNDALVMAFAGFALVMIARDYDQGLQATKRARELNPNIAFVSFIAGAALIIGGDPEQGLVCIEDAIRVSPGDPGAFFFYTGAALANLMCDRPAEACEMATRSARMYAGWDTTYRVLAAALVQLDRVEEARAAVQKLLELSPNMTVSSLRVLWPIRDASVLEKILDGLRTAGLPA